MWIHVVHASDIPYGGDVYVDRMKEEADPLVVWLNSTAFTQHDASIMAERLEANPSLLSVLVGASG